MGSVGSFVLPGKGRLPLHKRPEFNGFLAFVWLTMIAIVVWDALGSIPPWAQRYAFGMQPFFAWASTDV